MMGAGSINPKVTIDVSNIIYQLGFSSYLVFGSSINKIGIRDYCAIIPH